MHTLAARRPNRFRPLAGLALAFLLLSLSASDASAQHGRFGGGYGRGYGGFGGPGSYGRGYGGSYGPGFYNRGYGGSYGPGFSNRGYGGFYGYPYVRPYIAPPISAGFGYGGFGYGGLGYGGLGYRGAYPY